MPPYQLIRLLVAAFATSLNANKDNAPALATANAQIADLTAKLADANAKLSADDSQIAALGDPLSAEEQSHIADLLATVANGPTIAVPAPPAPAVADDGNTTQDMPTP